MLKTFYFLAVFVLVSIVSTHRVTAQVAAPTEPNCLEQAAAKIRPNSKVTIVKRDGSTQTGLLDSVYLSTSHLLLRSLSLEDSALVLFGQDEIAKIRYTGRGKFQPGYMVLGLIGGSLIGFAIGYALTGEGFDKPCTSEFLFGCLGYFSIGGGGIGFLVGGGVGLLGGAIIPTVLPSTRTIECK